jgi:hypothetical protein
LTVSEVLLEASFAFAVDVAFATEQREKYRQKDQGVGGRPEYKCDPYAEVVNFEDLLQVLVIRSQVGHTGAY